MCLLFRAEPTTDWLGAPNRLPPICFTIPVSSKLPLKWLPAGLMGAPLAQLISDAPIEQPLGCQLSPSRFPLPTYDRLPGSSQLQSDHPHLLARRCLSALRASLELPSLAYIRLPGGSHPASVQQPFCSQLSRQPVLMLPSEASKVLPDFCCRHPRCLSLA